MSAVKTRAPEGVQEVAVLEERPLLFQPIDAREYLERYVKRLALVGGFVTYASSRDVQHRALKSVSCLEMKGVVRPGRTIGLRVIVPETALGIHQQLDASAVNLAEALELRGNKAHYNPSPLAINIDRENAYDVLAIGIADMEARQPERDLGFVAVMDCPYATETFNLCSYSNVHEGRASVLCDVGEELRESRWSAGY